MDSGFITLDRKILTWQWFKKPLIAHFFNYALLRANWVDGKFQGIEIKRGQFASSLPSMAYESGLSVQSVRTAIKRLKSTGELTDHQQANFRIITIIKYDEYQQPNRLPNRKLTGDQQATNSNITREQEEQGNNIITNVIEQVQKPAYGNKEVNDMLLALKAKVGITAFVDSGIERNIAKHCVNLFQKLGKDEFLRRLDFLLKDSFHQKNCNKIKYIYNNIKGFIETKKDISKHTF